MKFVVECNKCSFWGRMENRSGGLHKSHYKCAVCGKSSKIFKVNGTTNIRGPLITKEIEHVLFLLNKPHNRRRGKENDVESQN